MTLLHSVLKNHTECSQEGPSLDSPSDLTMQILGYTKKVSTREGATLKHALCLLYQNEIRVQTFHHMILSYMCRSTNYYYMYLQIV